MLARKTASLAEAKDDLNETVEDHIIELRTEGLDSLRDELNETYEKWKKDLALNIDSIINTISDTANNMTSAIGGVNSTIDKYLGTFNKDLTLSNIGAEELTKENTTSIKDIDFSKDIAAQLKHYEENLSDDEYLRWAVTQGTQNETKEYTADIKEDTRDIREGMFGTKDNTEDQVTTQEETSDTVSDVAETTATMQDTMVDTNDAVQNIASTQQAYSESLTVLGEEFMPIMQENTEDIRSNVAMVREKGIAQQESMISGQNITNANLDNISGELDSINSNTSILTPIEQTTGAIQSTLSTILAAVRSMSTETWDDAITSGWDAVTSSSAASLFKESISKTSTKTTNVSATKSSPSVNVGSLITIEGNMDSGVAGKVEEIAVGLLNNKKFTDGIYSNVTKTTKQENRKRT